jgi:predicted Zn-dependent peptidase
MRYSKIFKNFTILTFILLQFAAPIFAQTGKISEPRQEKLLNGLKLLVWNKPQAEKIAVKLRIHSGSAFDPQGKEGVMALLAEAFFPNEAQREFFAEDF